MSVLDRPMFQNAGLVRGSQLPTSYGQSQQNTYTFEPTDNPDTVMYVEIDQEGNRVSEVPVDLTLSATRNPSEAFNRQRSERSLGRLQTAIGLGLSLIPTYRFGRMAITAAANRLKPIFAKIPQLTIRQRDTLTGPGSVAKLTNPNQIIGLTDAGKNVALGIGGAGGIAGLEALKPGPVDIQQELTELQTDPDRLSGSLFDPIKKPEEPEKPEKPEIVFDKAKISNVLSDEKFDAFLRALTGTLGTGFFTPAAQAPDIAAKALEAKKGSGTIKSETAKRNVEFNTNLYTATTNFNKLEKDIGRIEYAIDLLEKEGGVGLKGFFGEVKDRVQALFDGGESFAGINKRDGKAFEELEPRTKIKLIVDAIRQENIRELLGESGRTISNLDREIVAEIFGAITIDTPRAALIEKLNQIRRRFRDFLVREQGAVASNVNYFIETKQNSPIAFKGGELAAPIKRILSISNVLEYQVPKYKPGTDTLDIPEGEIIDAGSLGD